MQNFLQPLQVKFLTFCVVVLVFDRILASFAVTKDHNWKF